ncbi:hypothetical protein SapgrDRAFT_3191 [Saprospira grandis DSM 2844]|uniref:3'-phosphate/5'-hydroxy nucleic acid ligase n=1 Tax=Saprospira grandis DSM 2844 TaxID=694433 RepID=J0Y008_9BACT|nr:RtcB family protein [Saprospira grandis]EJF54836.1 hypothetical protein SapgrDRAFT_3191 [Saprospira grandis DSM 2844]
MAKKEKLKSKEIAALGYKDAVLRSMAMLAVGKHYKYTPKEEKMALLANLWKDAEAYRQDAVLGPLALKVLDYQAEVPQYDFVDKDFPIFGVEQIAQNALDQMKNAMRLPITKAGALMPDAHHGYGLPIGGVLATENAIIPYAVGVDIGCRMCMSVFEAPSDFLEKERAQLLKSLNLHSRFGRATFEDNKRGDDFFDRPEFGQLSILRRLKDKAYAQIGSSGGGNHFVEWGYLDLETERFGLPKGRYLTLLTHSGSRGFGAFLANHYSRLAQKKRQLPKEYAHLSWFNMEEAEGQEYWMAMNMAGDYASACHHHIHRRMAEGLGLQPYVRVENHHNFAWKEVHKGKELIVHRKGATPAAAGELGVIPGSMTAPAFLVEGKGLAAALGSASHGAGRKMSRRRATETFSKAEMKAILKNAGVELIGGGLDESPDAYKDIESVIAAQTDLLNVLGRFYPKLVRME